MVLVGPGDDSECTYSDGKMTRIHVRVRVFRKSVVSSGRMTEKEGWTTRRILAEDDFEGGARTFCSLAKIEIFPKFRRREVATPHPRRLFLTPKGAVLRKVSAGADINEPRLTSIRKIVTFRFSILCR